MRSGDTASPRELLDTAVEVLRSAGVTEARLDAELMLAHATGLTRERILTTVTPAVDAHSCERFQSMVARRAAREPLAYILGRREFYSLELEVTTAVLIPRPETETVVDAALDFLTKRPAARVLDIGTGSGALAIAVATNSQQASIVAIDISVEALEVARRNIDSHHLNHRIQLQHANCFNPINGGSLGRFDLVVSNPPYITEAEIGQLQPEIINYEPKLALKAGRDGLLFYRRIAAGLDRHLVDDGCAIVESGDGQSEAIAEIFLKQGFTRIRVQPDLAGTPRLLRIMR